MNYLSFGNLVNDYMPLDPEFIVLSNSPFVFSFLNNLSGPGDCEFSPSPLL
jgi:hypothetical protein